MRNICVLLVNNQRIAVRKTIGQPSTASYIISRVRQKLVGKPLLIPAFMNWFTTTLSTPLVAVLYLLNTICTQYPQPLLLERQMKIYRKVS